VTSLAAEHLRAKFGQIVLFLLLSLGAVVILLPVTWGMLSSFKDTGDVRRIPMQWVPSSVHPQNYLRPLRELPFPRYFLNSLIVALGTSLSQVVLCSMAGFGLAKYRFPGRDIIFVAILSTLMIPLVAIVVPLYIFTRQLGWLNTYQGLIVPFAVSAFGVFLMRQYILGIPDDYVDAARIDGATELQIFRQVVLPLASPAVGTLGLLSFVYAWNDFLWPLITVSRTQYRTLMLGIAVFQTEYSTNYAELLAMATLSSAPLVIIFIFMQRRFIESVTLSGLKG
jgi:multiple sugar transport system permease protein